MFSKWASHYVNLIACGVYLGLLFVGLLYTQLHILIDFKLGIYGLIVLAIFAFAYNYWRYLAISKAPLSTIASAAQGYVELNGVTSIEKTIYSPLHNIECVWHRSWAYAHDADNLWRLVDYQQSDEKFLLTDSTGTCTVDPKGAEVVHITKRTREHNGHRYVEEYLLSGFPLYLIGQLDTRHHFVDEKETVKQMGGLITDWKSEPEKMKRRFDLDRSGEIDQEEWGKARVEAREEIERRQMYKAHTGDFEISAPSNGQLYLLSGIHPKDLRKRYACWTLTHLAALAGLFILTQLF